MKNENEPPKPVQNPTPTPAHNPITQPQRPQTPPDGIEIHSDPNIPRPSPRSSPDKK